MNHLLAFTMIAAIACAAPTTDPPDRRGPLSKADAVGTCAGHCGGPSDGSCYCDDSCVSFGDCCEDYEPECTATEPPEHRFSCGSLDELRAVTDVLAAGDDCAEWVSAELGRVARSGAGSGSIYSRRTEHGVGLLFGAAHTRGEGFFGEPGTEIAPYLGPPALFAPASFVRLPEDDGSGARPLYSGVFILFHPEIPADESGNRLTEIQPRHDFFLSVVDRQLLEADFGQVTGELIREPLPLRDPLELTLTAPTFASPEPDATVRFMGYPNDGPLAQRLVANFGRVLGDDEVAEVMAGLAAVGDVEAEVPYDPTVEFFMEGRSRVGLSGGPVFDADGRQIGILVRGTEAEVDGKLYTRAVRLDFALAELERHLAALTPAEQEAVLPFLDR